DALWLPSTFLVVFPSTTGIHAKIVRLFAGLCSAKAAEGIGRYGSELSRQSRLSRNEKFMPNLNPVTTGIDALQADGFALLRGQRIGLITNHTGLNRDGEATADLLHAAPGVELCALFGPEHGIRGLLDA